MGMATQNQSTPTAAVAAKSIRPASPEGKTASRVNALKTSLAARLCAIPGNDSEELQALGWMHDSLEPASAHQRFLIDSHRRRLAIPPSRISRRRLNQPPGPKDSLRGFE